MPIVDGLSSAKMIRSFEKTHPQSSLSSNAARNGRVPIIAVSASLLERNLQTYIKAGFDGWILKPIDFKRLNTLLAAIFDDQVRNTCIYRPGQWEKGGWFERRQPGILRASTFPSRQNPVQLSPQQGTESQVIEDDSSNSGNSGNSNSVASDGSGTTETATATATEKSKPFFHDERQDAKESVTKVAALDDCIVEDVTDDPQA